MACPRNLTRPGYFTGFGLVADGDQRLSDWMRDNVRLALWPSPPGAVLGDVETEVLLDLQPPLNLSKVRTPWRPAISAARKRLAEQAATRSPDPDDEIRIVADWSRTVRARPDQASPAVTAGSARSLRFQAKGHSAPPDERPVTAPSRLDAACSLPVSREGDQACVRSAITRAWSLPTVSASV